VGRGGRHRFRLLLVGRGPCFRRLRLLRLVGGLGSGLGGLRGGDARGVAGGHGIGVPAPSDKELKDTGDTERETTQFPN